MKSTLISASWCIACCGLAITLMASGGCKKTTVEGPDGKKLTLTKPADQTLKRSGTEDIKVMISREKFRDAVAVKFENLPEGVTVQDKDKQIAAEETSATFTLKADEKAALVSGHEAKVTVTGPNGMQATESFKITVKEKG
jgi:hypothetical protein